MDDTNFIPATSTKLRCDQNIPEIPTRTSETINALAMSSLCRSYRERRFQQLL